MTETPESLLNQVMQYALDHYEQDGWDFLIETCGREDVLAVVRRCKTLKGALRAVRKEFALGLLDERRREIRSMGGVVT